MENTLVRWQFLIISLVVSNFSMADLVEEELQPSYELKIIADRGGESIEKYLSQVSDIYDNNPPKHLQERIRDIFPVKTTRMSVGKVTKEETSGINIKMLQQAIFIIGYDPVSINWLKRNKLLLHEKKAVGIVVNVESISQMDILQNIVGTDVILQASSGDSISEMLNIKHYPFYVDALGVMR